MNDITINNETNYEIDQITTEIITGIFDKLELDNISLSVNLVLDHTIQELNNQYRNIDSVTDVITFPYEEMDNFNELFEERELGDIFIAVDYVFANSIKIGNTMAREFSFVIAHGILHALGYDHIDEEHAREMFELQEVLITEVVLRGSVLNEIFSGKSE